MRGSAPLLQAKDFTQDTAAKAVIAAGGVLTTSLKSLICDRTEATVVACQVFDGISDLFKILIAMMVLDLITGVMASRIEGQRIESRRLGVGTQRKIVMLLVVATAVMLDAVFHEHHIPTGHLLYSWTASWFIAVEALSLYENASRIGVPLPKFLKAGMEFLLQRADQGGVTAFVAEATSIADPVQPQLPPAAAAPTTPEPHTIPFVQPEHMV